jgi:hypothetical protein
MLCIWYTQKDSIHAESESALNDDSHSDISANFKKKMNFNNELFDKSKLYTSVNVLMGKKLDKRYNLK